MLLINVIIFLLVRLTFSSNFVAPKTTNIYNYVNVIQFIKQVEELDGNFIMFYAPWCRHCTEFEPIWNELAALLNTEGSRYAIAQVDCTENEILCNENDITGYPSLLYFNKKNFHPVEYKGTRDLPSLTVFLNEMFTMKTELFQGPDIDFGSDEVKIHSGMAYLTDQNIEKFVSKGQHFIMFYAPWCTASQRQAIKWSQLAAEYANNATVQIGKVNCMEHRTICFNFDIKEYPQQLWIYNGKVISGTSIPQSLAQLRQFVNKMARPENHDPEGYFKKKKLLPVVRISDDTFDLYMKNENLIFINFFAPWCAHCMQLLPSWQQLGEKFINDSRIVIADVDCSQSHNLCAQEQVDHFPTLILYRNNKVIFRQKGSIPMEVIAKLIIDTLEEIAEETGDYKIKDEL